MTQEIKVPSLGESVTEAIIAQWLKKEGDSINADEPLVELETDKVTLEVNAPAAGVLSSIKAQEGATVEVGDVIASLEEGAEGKTAPQSETKPEPASEAVPAPTPTSTPESMPAPAPEPMAQSQPQEPSASVSGGGAEKLSPAVQKMVAENNLDASSIPGTGKDGRITKGDVQSYLKGGASPSGVGGATAIALEVPVTPMAPTQGLEERVRMTGLRRKIAERLKEAQNTAAMLTTFNEIDMTNVMAARAQYKEAFEKKHGVRLGFMSFFTKACILALKEIPAVNAEIDGDHIVYKNHYDIGVAVSTPQGLVVPVVRGADRLSFAEIEKTITDLGTRARDGKLTMTDLTGGTFTITNGGVFGSLMSTPILNPPQSGILGMHKIQKRPMVVGDSIEVRPMMYVAMTYDHRIIDGREAVTFLVRVKEYIEDPERILLDI